MLVRLLLEWPLEERLASESSAKSEFCEVGVRRAEVADADESLLDLRDHLVEVWADTLCEPETLPDITRDLASSNLLSKLPTDKASCGQACSPCGQARCTLA